MATCKTCICYDPVHRWCVAWNSSSCGGTKEPEHPACEEYLKAPDPKDIGQEE